MNVDFGKPIARIPSIYAKPLFSYIENIICYINFLSKWSVRFLSYIVHPELPEVSNNFLCTQVMIYNTVPTTKSFCENSSKD